MVTSKFIKKNNYIRDLIVTGQYILIVTNSFIDLLNAFQASGSRHRSKPLRLEIV